jgi:SPP1 family predicted phage head-tail adaptor
MRIGQSDRRITVERYTTTTNAYGERVQTWSTLLTVWAELMKTGEGMTERITSDQDMPVQRLRFKIRSSSDSRGIKADDRVLYNSKYYNIQGIEEIGRNDQLVLLCQITGT